MSIPEVAATSVLAGATERELAALRDDILKLEDRAAEDKLIRFVDWFTGSLDRRDLKDKYAYLAAAVKVQVGEQGSDSDSRTALEKELRGYDEWLGEMRLVTRLDGKRSLGVDQDFGLVVVLQHSTPVGQTSDLDHYQQLLFDKLTAMTGISSIISNFVMRQLVRKTELYLGHLK